MFDGTANALSYIALIAFVPFAIAMFYVMRASAAAAWLLLGAILYLPERVVIDPPVLPPIDKQSAASFAVLLGCYLRSSSRMRTARPLRGIDLLFVIASGGLFVTNLMNGDELHFGPLTIPGTTAWDSFAGTVKDALAVYVPFLVGRAMFRTPEDLRTFLKILVAATLFYSLPILFELRMSPRCHHDLYGFMQTDFMMTLRGGGYRPMVFMSGGLALAMLVLSAAIAAFALRRAGAEKAWKGPYLSMILVACKSTGAIIYGVATLPLVAIFRKPGTRVATFLAVLVLSFPILRATDTFPTDSIVEFFQQNFSEERALSLWFRFWNEDQLLERAAERRWFGWGGYGRYRVYDPSTGEDLSVTDGDWMIELGSRGILGFSCYYLMLAIPIFYARRKLASIPDVGDRWLVSALALIVGLNATDLLPNGLFSYYPFLFAGVLQGVLEGNAFRSKSRAVAAQHEARREARRRVAQA